MKALRSKLNISHDEYHIKDASAWAMKNIHFDQIRFFIFLKYFINYNLIQIDAKGFHFQ